MAKTIVFLKHEAKITNYNFRDVNVWKLKDEPEVRKGLLNYKGSKWDEIITSDQFLIYKEDLTPEETQQLTNKYSIEDAREIFYWGPHYEQATQLSPWFPVTNINDKPDKMQGYVVDNNEGFVTIYTQDLKQKIILSKKLFQKARKTNG